MISTIKRWGNSSAVRIPQHILSQAKMGEGMDVEFIFKHEGEIVLRAVRKRQSIQDIFADYDGGYLQTEEIDWGKPQGNEVW